MKKIVLAIILAMVIILPGLALACKPNGNEWVDVSRYLSESDLFRMPKNSRFCWQGFLCTRMFGDTVYCQLKDNN